MELRKAVIVQDRESWQFLCLGEDGDLDLTPSVRRAFCFENEETASISALDFLTGGFFLFQVYMPVRDEGIPRYDA